MFPLPSPLLMGTRDPYWPQVVLLAQLDEANGSTTLVDKTGRHTLVSNNGCATTNVTPPAFQSTSLLFDNVNDFISITDSADWNFGSGDFTVEYFARHDTTTVDASICQFGSTDKAWGIFEGTNLEFDYSTDGTTNVVVAGSIAGTGSWLHRMVSRVGNTLYIGYDGTIIATGSVSGVTMRDSARPLVFGANNDGTTAFYQGRLAAIRITKGVGRYSGSVSSSYVIPAQPYPIN